MKKKVLLRILALVLILLAAAGYDYLKPYKPDRDALAAMQSSAAVTVTEEGGLLHFEPSNAGPTTVIFYPGGLVTPESYAPYAKELAGDGYRTFIVKMPLNLAVLGADRADEVVDAWKGKTERFIIGGHSLGGTMAARYAASHAEVISGVFFMGSYPEAKGNLAQAGIPALSVTGSRDGVLNRERFEESKKLLPADTVYFTVSGGNHSQFGSYGLQKGDNEAQTSPAAQRQEVTDMMESWISSLKP
ncbi:alpha/beta family hydrolase [Paenibacillus gansuensis]|uniref:Alpha/beta family hydrolase n=1 Tax=Paenibacillus gansuensis TaxID=306542 RepID=A0ABW5PBZ3_9BACL